MRFMSLKVEVENQKEEEAGMDISFSDFKYIVISSVQSVQDKEYVEIKNSEKFEDAGLDSLDRMNLLLELEERTGLDLGELDLGVQNTLEVLYQAITEKME